MTKKRTSLEILSTRVRRWRKANGYTLLDVAEMADNYPSSISLMERGREWPTKERLERLAKAMGLTVCQLFYDGDDCPHLKH